MSEANKDESERCINIAKNFMKKGDYVEAEKYLKKSQRLFFLNEAKELIQKITKEKQQNNLAEKVLRETDYYKILGVDRSASKDQIKSAYKKLALKLHPDKNGSPKASEAFKSVNRAFSVLNNDSNRSNYDVSGREENPRFEENISPEDIFRAFFANEFGVDGVHFRRHYRARNYQEREQNGTNWVAAIPLIIFVVIPVLMSLLSSDPVFSMNWSRSYSVHHRTKLHDLDFYVKPDFKGDVSTLENEVIREYVKHLTDLCNQEIQIKNKLEFMAYWGDRDALQQLKSFTMTYCQRLDKLKRK